MKCQTFLTCTAISLSFVSLTACHPSSTPSQSTTTLPTSQPPSTTTPVPNSSDNPFIPIPTPIPTSSPSDNAPTTQVVSLPDGTQLILTFDKSYFRFKGETLQLHFDLQDAQGNPLPTEGLKFLFSSSRPQDLSVSDKGLVTALVTDGFSTITVQLADSDIKIARSFSVVSDAGYGSGNSGGGGGGGILPTPTPTPPAAFITASKTEVVGGGVWVKLDGTSAYFTQSPLNYSWSCIESDCGLFSSSDTAQSYWQSPGMAGVYTLLLNVNAGSESAQVTRKITVTTGTATVNTETTLPPNHIWYVNDNASGDNSCSNWANACTDLQLALAASSAGDIIYVAEGIYKPTSDTDRTRSFVLKSGVKIYGGFDDTAPAARPAERNVNTDVSILSGDIGTVSNTSDNSYHVLSSTGITADSGTEINGFTVQDGKANGSSFPDNSGGGMYNDNSSPKLNHMDFFSNSATEGGGIYNDNSNPILENSYISTNRATRGGGIYNKASNGTLDNTGLTFNVSSVEGGGMYNNSSNPVLSNVDLDSNKSDAWGAGMYNSNSSPTLSNAIFSSNTANLHGGGMYNSNSSPTLSNAIFSSNRAANGGGMYNTSSSPTLSKTLFFSNSANGGGGMYNTGSSSLTLSNALFVSNTANFHGGGICNTGSSSLTLSNATFSSNTASSGGGGMYNDSSNPILVNVLWYMSSLSGVTLNNPNAQTHYTTYDDGNVVIADDQGDNFFVDLANFGGANNTFGDSDDGLKLQDGVGFYNYGLTSHASATIPTTDITGTSRTGHNTPGAYQANN